MADLVVRYEGGDRLSVAVRGHSMTVDQRIADGGEDVGPTPTELFVSGLAACVGFYAQRFMRRHALDPAGLVVACDFDFSEGGPARVSQIRVAVTAPGLPEALHVPFVRVIEHCTVHNSLVRPPTVTIDLVEAVKAA
jgi:uncharacterized OsmC-like protein